jgi:hypothetical protein
MEVIKSHEIKIVRACYFTLLMIGTNQPNSTQDSNSFPHKILQAHRAHIAGPW